MSSGVGSSWEKIGKKNFTLQKSSNTVKIFHLEFGKHRQILIPRISILDIYVTNPSAWAS